MQEGDISIISVEMKSININKTDKGENKPLYKN